MSNFKLYSENQNNEKPKSPAMKSDGENYTDGEKSCIRSAMNILVYGDNTEKKLREKLFNKDFAQNEIDAAIEYVIGKGYLNEMRQLERTAEMYATVRLFGKRRIVAELFKKGYKQKDIAQIDFEGMGIDFVECCSALLVKQFRLYDDEDRRNFVPDDKIKGGLIRCGYTISEINQAVKLIHESAESKDTDNADSANGPAD